MDVIAKNIQFLRNRVMHLTQRELAEKLGLNSEKNIGAYEEGRTNPKIKVLCKIAKLFKVSVEHLVETDLEKVWDDPDFQDMLLNNDPSSKAHIKGKNLQPRTVVVPTDESNEELILLVPQKASAGYKNGIADREYIESLQRFKLPFLPNNSTYRAFEIKGDSMLPIPSGSFVVGEYVENWYNIKNGDTYVVVSQEGDIMFKRLWNNIEKNGTIWLCSDNTSYEPILLDITNVYEIWKTKSLITNGQAMGDTFLEKLLAEITQLRLTINNFQQKN